MVCVYATGWYTVTLAHLLGSFGQYSKFIACGRVVQWDAEEGRYVAR